MSHNKAIFGLVFALSFSLFIGSGLSAYAANDPPQSQNDCNPHSTFTPGGIPSCVCDEGYQQSGGTDTLPICVLIPTGPVGGMGIPIDTTALLLAGVQGSALWMVPAIVIAGAGIGFFTFRKSKKNKESNN